MLGESFSPPVHLRHSGGRKENPSENHNLITPICSGTASHFCLPGCLSLMLSSTLFSISCNHLLEISFSFKMSPWKGNSASWEWAETTMRKPVQKQPSVGRMASTHPTLIKPHSRFLPRVGLFKCPAAVTSPWLVVSANKAVGASSCSWEEILSRQSQQFHGTMLLTAGSQWRVEEPMTVPALEDLFFHHQLRLASCHPVCLLMPRCACCIPEEAVPAAPPCHSLL